MRTIEYTGPFKRDYKREKRTNSKLNEVLEPVIQLLAADASLPERLFDHGLSGAWKGFRDCHVKPDLVLIYEKPEGVLSLVRLGSHSEVFG
jgi:mRNA interferase YafQ